MPNSERYPAGAAQGECGQNPVEGPHALTPISALAIMYAHKTPIRASVDILFGANDQEQDFTASRISPPSRPILNRQTLSVGLNSMVGVGLLEYTEEDMAQRHNKLYVTTPLLRPLVNAFNGMHIQLIAQQTGVSRYDVLRWASLMLRDACLDDSTVPIERIVPAVQRRTGISTEHVVHRMLGSFAFIHGYDVVVDDLIRAKVRNHPYATTGPQRRSWRVGKASGSSMQAP